MNEKQAVDEIISDESLEKCSQLYDEFMQAFLFDEMPEIWLSMHLWNEHDIGFTGMWSDGVDLLMCNVFDKTKLVSSSIDDIPF